jgi:hypothetical protein
MYSFIFLVSLPCFGIVLPFPYVFGSVFLLQFSAFFLIFVLQDNETSSLKKNIEKRIVVECLASYNQRHWECQYGISVCHRLTATPVPSDSSSPHHVSPPSNPSTSLLVMALVGSGVVFRWHHRKAILRDQKLNDRCFAGVRSQLRWRRMTNNR